MGYIEHLLINLTANVMGVLSRERYQLSLENVERVWTRQLFFWPAAGAYRPRRDVAEHFECPAYNPKKDTKLTTAGNNMLPPTAEHTSVKTTGP